MCLEVTREDGSPVGELGLSSDCLSSITNPTYLLENLSISDSFSPWAKYQLQTSKVSVGTTAL